MQKAMRQNDIRKKFSVHDRVIPYLFVAPVFIFHLCLVAIPAVSTLIMSFYEWNGMGAARFIGFDNFIFMFTKDNVVGHAVMNNLKWTAIFLTVPIFLGFVIAVLVSNIKKFQMFFRTVYFIPYVISAAVVGKIWTAYFNPFYGVNLLFESWGWHGLANTLWLGDPNIAIYSVAFVDNWRWWGFVMMLFLGALQQIDTSLYESARVDGSNKLQELWYISIPGIRQTLAFVLIMTVMWSFLTFDYVYVMTNGGPGNSSEILATWIYKNAFVRYNAGYANALCVVQSAICLGFYFIQRYAMKKGGLADAQ